VDNGGVWAVCDLDYGESITAVYATELDALRAINGRGYGRVRFVPWGKSLMQLESGVDDCPRDLNCTLKPGHDGDCADER